MKIYGVKARKPEQKGNIRDIRPLWLLEEIGAPYESVLLDGAAGELDDPAFVARNPYKKVPVLEDGDLVLFESTAICTYLCDKYQALIPPVGSRQRALTEQWLYAAVASLEPHTVRVFACDVFFPSNDQTTAIRALAARMADEQVRIVDHHLAAHTYMVGDAFSVVDVVMSCSLRFLAHTDLLAPYVAVTRYLERAFARPAYLRAFARNGGIP